MQAMQVRRLDDPRAFLEASMPLLMRDEARHNLVFAIVDTLMRHPSVYPAWHLWLVEDAEDVRGVALQTPPHNLVLAQPTDRGALDALVDAISGRGLALPGVSGPVPEAIEFAQRWIARAGGSTRTRMSLGVYAQRTVRDLPRAPGAMRRAGTDDIGTITAWIQAFAEEAEVGAIHDPDQRHRMIEARLSSGDEAGFWFWVDGDLDVSMTGFAVATPNGSRIGPVYTPPELRGRGYATTLVADASSWLLERGSTFCFLFTDLANPTSNAIYQRIGYEQVCEAIDIAFDP
jgi:uncharacterized protein